MNGYGETSQTGGNIPSRILQFTRVVGTAVLVAAAILLVIWRQARPQWGGLKPGESIPALHASGWINGPPLNNDELKGRIVVIDAWATWCGPCRAKAPHLAEIHRRYKDQGVVFIGLTDEGAESLPAIEQFIKESGISWPNGFGAGQTLAAFQHEGIPAVWVVGRDGHVVWNSDSPGEIEDGIERALAAPGD